MTHPIDAALAERGIVLPEPPTPVASYVGAVAAGGMLFVSGQLPVKNGDPVALGRLGLTPEDQDFIKPEDAAAAAQLCAINILAQVKAALGGDWNRLKRCVKLGGFVASTPEFTEHPKVVNGASDFMGAILGEIGAHSRIAVGVAALPLGVPVEIDAIFEIDA